MRLCLSECPRERGGVLSLYRLIEYGRGNTQTTLGLGLSTKPEV